MQYFWSLTQTLRPVISNEELIKMIENLLDNITYNVKNHHLNIEKLNLMQIIIADSLFLDRKGTWPIYNFVALIRYLYYLRRRRTASYNRSSLDNAFVVNSHGRSFQVQLLN